MAYGNMDKDYVAGLVERLGAFRMRFDMPMSEDDFMAHWSALRESRTTLTALAAALAEKDAETARTVNSYADLLAALERVEPNIGWRGRPEDDLDSDLYACEFCAGTAALRDDIYHHEDCLVFAVRAAIAAARTR